MLKTKWIGRSGVAAALLILAGLLGISAGATRAQDQPGYPGEQGLPGDQSDEGDPPSRVARISYLDGTVSLQPGGEGDWANAALNRPMTIGDKIWSDKDARVELQAGVVTIHLGSMTALSFLNLDEAITQMRLAEGSINFRVSEMREGDLYEVDTPNLAFTVKEAGAFRVDVNENGDGTRVTVIRGTGEVTSGGKTYTVKAGERAEFNGTENNIRYSVNQAPAPDGLDRWSSQRDSKEDNSQSAKYVSRDMVGYGDLDDHGTWSEEPEYGHVWYPNDVDDDWAPYSTGNWNYVGPWGWTWVDTSPWGFAPYHYGRWNYFGHRWGWCPGPYYGRPIYGPAFVGFVGGSHWGVGFGFGGGWGIGGGIGWFPLGWGEAYHPWYHAGGRYLRNINVHNTYIRNVNVINNSRSNNYRYARNVRAVTATSHDGFVNGQRVNRGAARLTEANLRGAQVSNRNQFTPTRASFTGAASRGGRVATPAAGIQNRSVVARTAPAAGASHMPVRTMNTANLSNGRANGAATNSGANRAGSGLNNNPGNRPASSRETNGGFNQRGNAPNSGAAGGRPNGAAGNSGTSPRQRELSQSRPPSAAQSHMIRSTNGGTNPSGTRTWEAQGGQTDRGRGPAGFGSQSNSANRPDGGAAQATRMNDGNRPPFARGNDASGNSNARSSQGYGNGRGYNGDNRANAPAQRTPPNSSRSYSPQRQYNAPSRSSSAPPRSYSAPSRSYPAPSRSNAAPRSGGSAPSRPSGGGGAPRGGSGGSPHGGGGGSHTRH